MPRNQKTPASSSQADKKTKSKKKGPAGTPSNAAAANGSSFLKSFGEVDPEVQSAGKSTPVRPNLFATPAAPAKKTAAAKKKLSMEAEKQDGSESDPEVIEPARNSLGQIIRSLDGSVASPPKKRKKFPKEEQISDAYLVSTNINMYLITKKWDKSERDYVQMERTYQNAAGEPATYTFSFDVNHADMVIQVLQELHNQYKQNHEETEGEEEEEEEQQEDESE